MKKYFNNDMGSTNYKNDINTGLKLNCVLTVMLLTKRKRRTNR
ncbi:hypothetical protein CL6EHI_c00123 [Entamoeba histolytica]|uniref:Uncharacterized protein n=1 Tax=Entamoeba histolytica TaxID=5759 RepID=A0A175JSX7_ENTHI|nr:hypothetical protein CL6EHI_c00123 [Entamoeba histolytica]